MIFLRTHVHRVPDDAQRAVIYDKGVTIQIIVTQELTWVSRVVLTKYQSKIYNHRSQKQI